MKFVLVLTILCIAWCSAPEPVRETSARGGPYGDCRPHAEVERTDRGALRITFNRNLSEIVDGEVFCDFGYVRTPVEKAQIGGKKLQFVGGDDAPVYSIRDASVEMTDPISCELDGVSFISDSSSIEETANRLTVRLKQFPPK